MAIEPGPIRPRYHPTGPLRFRNIPSPPSTFATQILPFTVRRSTHFPQLQPQQLVLVD